MSFNAVVVAAGIGERFGGAKHLVEIDGVPLWQICRNTLLAAGAGHVMLVGDVPGGIPGGERRRDSAAAGVRAVPESEFVLVHDAARPLVTVDLVWRVVERLEQRDVDGVVPALPVRDALKQVEGDSVETTVDRRRLVTVQTPQGFVTESLANSYRHSINDAVDDAELVQRWGGTVVTVEGEPTNVKITYPSDLELAQAIWQSRG